MNEACELVPSMTGVTRSLFKYIKILWRCHLHFHSIWVSIFKMWKIRRLERKVQYIQRLTTPREYLQRVFLSCTLFESKAYIVLLMNVTNHKCIGVDKTVMTWTDYNIAAKTADHTNTSLVAVCCSMKYHVITPSAVFLHASQVIRP